MKYGAYSPDKTYSVAQIRDLVSYAKQRGIKVIPEIDQPAHSGEGKRKWIKMNISICKYYANRHFRLLFHY